MIEVNRITCYFNNLYNYQRMRSATLRLNPASRTFYRKGAGLGLYTPYGITKPDSGRIQMKSTPSGRTTFPISLHLECLEDPDENLGISEYILQ